MKATWNGQVIAESNQTKVIEGNHYFPPESVNQSFLTKTDTTSQCPWKGQAHYYTITVDGQENPDAAWYYPSPSEAALEIKDHVAFWKGVKVSES